VTISNLVLGVPPQILNLVQQGLLERSFHDGLFPALMYRGEAQEEQWEANTGTEIFMSRPGLLPPVTRAIAAGVDPTPQTVAYEQWAARLSRYAGTIDTHVPTSVVSNADQFLRNIHQLGLQAGQSLNRIPRNEIFSAYLSGQTNLTAATTAIATSISVASLNGFTDVILQGAVGVRPVPVSSSAPKRITIDPSTAAIVRNVVQAIPDDPDDPKGPGQLVLDAAVGAIVATRATVLAVDAPTVIRAGGGDSVDSIGSSDIFTLQDAINVTNRLRKNSVPPHEDGYYHAHINTDANSQVFEDPAFQRLNTALPDHVYYQEAFIGTIAGIAFFLNNESPELGNAGDVTNTSALARYSSDIGAETVNNAGVAIGRILVTGRGAIYEKWLDEKAYVTEAGITGKTGEFQIVNSGIEVMTERIRLILRAPINRLQDMVAASWSITTSFPVPSDITSGGPQRYKRAMIIEHAAAA
jgi:hypothetical protein